MHIMFTATQIFFSIYWYVLLATVLISFVPDIRQTSFGHLLSGLTDPYLYVFRRYIRPLPLGPVTLDLSWIVGVAVFFVINHAVSVLLVRLMLNAS